MVLLPRMRGNDAQQCNRPERQAASLLGSRRAARAGARSLQALGVTQMTITPTRTGLLVAGIAFTFFAIVINIQPHGWLAWYRLSCSGQETQATIVRRQPEIHQTCFFQYAVNSHKYEGSDQGCHSQVGETLSVTYLPANPTFATLASPREQLAFLVFAPLFLSALAGVFGAWRTKARLRTA
jgi:hypothetical protein